MNINAASSPSRQRSISESSVYRPVSEINSTHSLDYLDLARASQQLTDNLYQALQQPSQTEIDAALEALNAILAAAESEGAESLSALPVDCQHLHSQLSRYIFENEAIVDYELCGRLRDINESHLNSTSTPDAESAGYWTRFKNVLSLAANDNVCRYVQNGKNIALSSILCVALPTLMRQIVAYEVENTLEDNAASQNTRFTLAAFAGILPMVLNLAGGVRECLQGSATTLSTFSRALNIGISSAALIAAASTGALSGLASTLISFQFYSLLRESTQTFFRISNNTPVHALGTLATAGLYIPNQIATSVSMTASASPSGVLAAAQHSSYLNILPNDLSRMALNTIGEAVDLSVFSGLNALQSGIKLKNRLDVGLPDKKRITNTLFAALPARMALMNTPILISMALQTALTEHLDEPTLVLLDDILCATILGTLYPLFVATLVKADKPDSSKA